MSTSRAEPALRAALVLALLSCRERAAPSAASDASASAAPAASSAAVAAISAAPSGRRTAALRWLLAGRTLRHHAGAEAPRPLPAHGAHRGWARRLDGGDRAALRRRGGRARAVRVRRNALRAGGETQGRAAH